MGNKELEDFKCSIFKSKTNSDLKKNFTRKWIEIINKSEKEKSGNFSKL